MAVNLHEGQSEIFTDLFIEKKHRFITAACSRGWGKSHGGSTCAVTAAAELIELDASVPNKNIYIIAPTHDQVTDIYFPILFYDLGLEHFALKSSRDTGRFKLPRNVELRLISYEAVERMRGKGAYFALWDEVSSCTKGVQPREAWEDIIMPCINTRWSPMRAAHFKAKSPGRGLIIGTPKGYNFFHTLFTMPDLDDRYGSYQYDYTKSPFLDPDEIERLKHTMDPIAFASEYLASFKESGNNIFYCFDRKIHVNKDVQDFLPSEDNRPGENVHVCIDFNVGIMAASAWAIRGNQMHCIDDFKGHPDTETLAITLKDKYKGHKIYAYPDPTGRARKSSAAVGITDFSILQAHGIQCLARTKSPPIVDSVAAVNKKLMTAAGDVDMYLHPRCINTINSLERSKWVDKNMDSATIDKSEGIEHHSDGVRYMTEYLFPIQTSHTRTKRGFGF